MDRKALKIPFTRHSCPDWTCPTCGKGVLRIDPERFFQDEKAESRDHSHEAWEPEWIQYVYSCILVCSNDQCNEAVVSSGRGRVDESYYEDENGQLCQDWVDVFKPLFFEPHLKLINIPPGCPDSVSSPLTESFRVFFSVPAAASNNVRIAIEELLTELKVKRFNVVNGKRRIISLHQRIALIPPKYDQLKDLVLAIKWLGNAGSHGNGEGKITADDVLDAYDLTEHILHEIYAPKIKKLAALAKQVNKKKGPAKRIKRAK